MISKELLSEVLNLNMWKTETITIKYDCNKIEWNGIFLGDCGYYKSFDYINIYELAHLCKEWAYKQKQSYRVTSGFTNLPDYDYEAIIENPTSTGVKREIFEAESEPEAVFQACQWILDNKDTK